MNKLEQIRAVINVWLRHPSDDPIEGAYDSLSSIVDILDDSDATDELHADPELNRVADLRTAASDTDVSAFGPYIALRGAQRAVERDRGHMRSLAERLESIAADENVGLDTMDREALEASAEYLK